MATTTTTTTSIIERIKNNDPSVTSIDFQYQNTTCADDGEYEGIIFDEYGVTDTILSDLAEALQNNTYVTEIELSENEYITSSGWIALAESLRYNTAISRIVLATVDMKLKAVQKFADVLEHSNRSVSIVELWENHKIGIPGITAIIQALIKNTTITEVFMSQTNQATSTGSQKKLSRIIQQMLEQNTTLQVLQLSHNHLRSTFMKGLSNGLKTNQCLQDLVLRSNNIGNTGAILLGDALRYNTTLQCFNIDNNNIDDDGLNAIITALRYYNHTLHSFEARDNNITEISVLALLDVLKYNTTFQAANIITDTIRDNNNPNPLFEERLHDILHYNTFYFIDIPVNMSPTTHKLLEQNRNEERRAPYKYYAVYNWLFQYQIVWGSIVVATTTTTTPAAPPLSSSTNTPPNKKQKIIN